MTVHPRQCTPLACSTDAEEFLMPQFPIPPWPEGASPLTTRRCRVRASGRHRFVPVVHGDADGVTVHLDSGDEAAIDRARFASNAETLFFQDNVGKPHL